jgi:putative transposase
MGHLTPGRTRAIVGWTVEDRESDTVAERLIAATAARQGIDRDRLVLHSERGPQMTSMTVAELLADLGVTRSLSRPRVSNDCDDGVVLPEAV